jgi:bla regulator protein blaR1
VTNAALLSGLWQGALIAGIAALAARLVPRRHAATRYTVWFASLLALAVVPFSTVWHPAAAFAALPAPVERTAAVTSLVTARAADASGSWLTLLWLAGVAVGVLRLCFSYARIERIVRAATPAPELGPDVLLSDEIAVPIAARLFRPVVIVPAYLPASLERSDLESVVQHERAHIRRMDVWGNFVQRSIETLLFFNPWAYLIGRQLVKEREAACDDWAVAATGRPDRYASCLARLAQGAAPARVPLLTPSAIGSRRVLVGRITRLLDGKAAQLKVNYLLPTASVAAYLALAVLLQTTNGLASVASPGKTETVAAAKVSCTFPNGYAGAKPVNPAMPDIPQSANVPNLSAEVLVTILPDGRPSNPRIVKSSGSAAVDKATIDAAMASTYTPATAACKPVADDYLFKVATGP